MKRVVVYVVLSFLSLAPLVASAQDATPALVNMRTVQIKPDTTADYEALIRELRDAWREVGIDFYLVYRVARGNTNEYVILTPVNQFSDFDEPFPTAEILAPTQWVARINRTVVGGQLETLRPLADLTIPLAEGREPQLAVLSMRRHLPGRRVDYLNWLRDQYVPAMREAGRNGVFQLGNAFEGQRWYQLRLVDNWAEFDGPNEIVQNIGLEAFSAMMNTGSSLSTPETDKVLRLLPGLSILPNQ